MYTDLCLCEALPLLDLPTRVIIFMHRSEHHLITNTGILAHRLLKNSRIVYRGQRDKSVVQRDDILGEAEKGRTYILYPEGEAAELNGDFLKKNPGPLTLICPDGHWGQAKKIVRQEPSLQGIPCVKLPEGIQSQYRLRRNIQESRVCTVEAIARALGVLEGPPVQDSMEAAFQKMVTRLLWMRGKIPRREVVW